MADWKERPRYDLTKWSQSGVQRRDRRATHDDPPERALSRRKKDTKRWCRGKVGQEHDYVHWYTKTYSFFNRTYTVYRCSRCRKKHYTDE